MIQQVEYDTYVNRLTYSPGTDIRNSADILVYQYEEEKLRLEAEVDKELISKLTSELRDLLSTRKLRHLEHDFEKLLAEFDIVYKQHYTMTLTGEPCHRLLINSEEILDRFRAILLFGLELHVDGVPDKTEEEKESLIEQIERMTVRLKDIMATLDYIVSVMREDRGHTDEECTTFKLACDYFGYIWRLYGLPAIPKLHYLEAHCPPFLQQFRRFFGEDGMERLHTSNNRFNRVLACLKRHEDRINKREIRKESTNLPGVQTANAEVKNGTNRNFSEQTKAKRKVEEEKKAAEMNKRRNQVTSELNDGTRSF